MNRRVMLVFGAVALLAACIILYIALNTDGSATANPTASGDGAANDVAMAAPDPRTEARPRRRSDDPPPGTEVRVLPDGTREWMRGDVLVRDHRKQPYVPHDPIPKRAPRNDGRTIARTVTSDLNKVFQPVLRECAASIPAASRGKQPRLDGVMTIAIKDHQVSVTDTAVALRDVDGDAGIAEFKKCLSEKSAGLAAQAPGETDVDSYEITLSMSLPRAPQPR